MNGNAVSNRLPLNFETKALFLRFHEVSNQNAVRLGNKTINSMKEYECHGHKYDGAANINTTQGLEEIMETLYILYTSLLIWCWTTFCLQYSQIPSWNGLVQVLNSL
jgi:hypothetical protein